MFNSFWKEVILAYDRYKLHIQAVLGFLAIVALLRFVPESWLQHPVLLNSLTLRILIGIVLVLFVLNLIFFFQVRKLRSDIVAKDLLKSGASERKRKRDKQTLDILKALGSGLFKSKGN